MVNLPEFVLYNTTSQEHIYTESEYLAEQSVFRKMSPFVLVVVAESGGTPYMTFLR